MAMRRRPSSGGGAALRGYLGVVYVLRGFAGGCAVMLVLFGLLAIWPTQFETSMYRDEWALRAVWHAAPVVVIVAGAICVPRFLRGQWSAVAWLALGLVVAGGWTALLVLATDIGGIPTLTIPIE